MGRSPSTNLISRRVALCPRPLPDGCAAAGYATDDWADDAYVDDSHIDDDHSNTGCTNDRHLNTGHPNDDCIDTSADPPAGNAASTSRSKLVQQLQRKIHHLQSVSRADDGSLIPACCEDVAGLLHGGGYRRGTIIEWIVNPGFSQCDRQTRESQQSPHSTPGHTERGNSTSGHSHGLRASGGFGVDYVSLLTAASACKDGGALVVIDSESNFYPPAAAAAGIDLNNVIILRPAAEKQKPRRDSSPTLPASFYWAIDQALKCSAVAAVWGPVDTIDERWFRRFQLSAEASGVTGMFIRPSSALNQPGWSEVQWHVSAHNRHNGLRNHRRSVSLKLARARSGPAGGTVHLEIDTITGRVHPATAVPREHEHQREREHRNGGHRHGPGPANTSELEQQTGTRRAQRTLRKANPVSPPARLADPEIDRRAGAAS